MHQKRLTAACIHPSHCVQHHACTTPHPTRDMQPQQQLLPTHHATLPLTPSPCTPTPPQEQLQQQREAASSATSELAELRVVYGKLEATAGKLREAQEGAARELAEQLTKSREAGAALEKQKEKAAHFRWVVVWVWGVLGVGCVGVGGGSASLGVGMCSCRTLLGAAVGQSARCGVQVLAWPGPAQLAPC